MEELPPPVTKYLRRICLEIRSPAYLRVDGDCRLLDSGGDLSAYGLAGFKPGDDVREGADILAALLPADGDLDVVECIELDGGRYVDVHLIRAGECTRVLLLDATADAGRRQLLQQKGNELALLRDELKRRNEELDRKNAVITAANERIRRDLEAAAKIQHSLLPTSAPQLPGVDFAWIYEPCDELAGDTLNVFQLDEEHVAFYLADVSGHGVPAALLSVTVSRVLSPAFQSADQLLRPAELARRVNGRFLADDDNIQTQYFTLLYGVLDVAARTLHHVCAGHCPPIHLPVTGEAAQLEGSNPPIGWLPEAEYETQSTTLQPGDRLYVHSDGLVEAPSPDGEQFGESRLIRTLRECRTVPLAASLSHVREEVETWCNRSRQDDVSMVALEVTAP